MKRVNCSLALLVRACGVKTLLWQIEVKIQRELQRSLQGHKELGVLSFFRTAKSQVCWAATSTTGPQCISNHSITALQIRFTVDKVILIHLFYLGSN